MKWNARQIRIEEELDEIRKDPVLEEALKDFRLSVHAWSEAAMNRPRKPIHSAVRTTWRLVVTWALGCLLAAGTLGGALYERYHRQEMARQATAEEARQKQLAVEAAAASVREQGGTVNTREQDEQLLAEVDEIGRAHV